MSVRIYAVYTGSPAERAGIKPDDILLSINGEPVQDEIDYQALSSLSSLNVQIENLEGRREFRIRKNDWEPLGLCLDETEAMKPRRCRNRCLFCFVDQLPSGMRETLYVKDDDWRLSLMMGNYVTLTNVSNDEFERIIARKASPLYISVHATDPEVRCSMLRNKHAGLLMERLQRMKENGLQFHCQIVLCPGINDGSVLDRTILDLASLYPAARSLAIVPVGLTRYRNKLYPLKMFNAESARKLLSDVLLCQQRFLKEIGTRFVFPSDEFYCLCGEEVPEDNDYEDYPQIENGVGMLRLLAEECKTAFETLPPESFHDTGIKRKLLIPTGVSAHPFIDSLCRVYAPDSTTVQVIPVINRYFGETITVTGLLVGQDLVNALKDIACDEILLCDTMLRDQTDRFLDDTSVDDVMHQLKKPIRIVRNNGESLIRALWGMEDRNV